MIGTRDIWYTLSLVYVSPQEFLSSFLLQNPLAQVAIVVMADSAAEVLLPISSLDSSSHIGIPTGSTDTCYFSSNVEELAAVLKARKRSRSLPTANAPSLKNGLDVRRCIAFTLGH